MLKLYDLSINAVKNPAYAPCKELYIGWKLDSDQTGVLQTAYILYEDADQPLGFSQLSDMIDAGEATEEQIELYAELKRIEQGVLENCDFLFENTEYDDKVIAGVDLARLAVTLERVEYGDFAGEGW